MQKKHSVTISGILLVSLIGILDYLTGEEISFSIFYLLPIAYVTWETGGRVYGYLMSAISATAWLVADLKTGHKYSHFLIPYWNMLVRLGIFLIIAVILTKLRRSLQHEQEMARTDGLTGVANSRHFYEMVNSEIYRSQRFSRQVTFAYIDVDNFKEVNDTLGHGAGDELLRGIATTIQSNIRSSDVVARLGGDEFALVLPETSDLKAKKAVDKLHQLLTRFAVEKGLRVTFSIGVVTCVSSRCTADEMVRAADDLMYSVKKDGKNAIRYKVIN